VCALVSCVTDSSAGHIYDILEYNKMFEAVTAWVSKRESDDIALISTSDHECGGLTLAEQRPEDSEVSDSYTSWRGLPMILKRLNADRGGS
jgi:alkaline phosphatase